MFHLNACPWMFWLLATLPCHAMILRWESSVRWSLHRQSHTSIWWGTYPRWSVWTLDESKKDKMETLNGRLVAFRRENSNSGNLWQAWIPHSTLFDLSYLSCCIRMDWANMHGRCRTRIGVWHIHPRWNCPHCTHFIWSLQCKFHRELWERHWGYCAWRFSSTTRGLIPTKNWRLRVSTCFNMFQPEQFKYNDMIRYESQGALSLEFFR